MAENFSYSILIKVVAQICEMVGFHQTTTSSVSVLADVLQEYLLNLGRKTRQYAEHTGRSGIDLSDLCLAFNDFKISPQELIKFYQAIGPIPTSLSVPKYPVPKRENLLVPYFQQSLQQNDKVEVENVEVENVDPCSLEESNQSKPKANLKIKISLSKIKEARETKKNKSKKKKKKRGKEKV